MGIEVGIPLDVVVDDVLDGSFSSFEFAAFVFEDAVVDGVVFISFSISFLKFALLSVATDSLITVRGRLDAGISGTAAAAIS